MNKFTVIFLLLLLTVLSTANAQQDPQYTQYMYNTQVINPAYAGSRGVFSTSLLYRSQWTGIDGAPTTQTFNLHTPVSQTVGLGLSVVNDEIGNGVNQNTYFNGDFSYSLDLSKNSKNAKLSFGVKAAGHLLNVNLNKLRNLNTGVLPSDFTVIDKKFSPNFGAGVYYHTDNFYLGASIPNFLVTEHFETTPGSNSFLVKEQMQYYLISGLVIDLNYLLKFKPSLLLRFVSGTPVQADLSANFLYKDIVSFGAAYRVNGAASALVGIQANDKLMLGIAYDRETSNLGGLVFNDGSFEFFVRFELLTRHKKVVAPRFF